MAHKPHPIDRASDAVGGSNKLAALLGVTPAAVTNWKARGSIPVEHCIAIEAATKGKVSRRELRDDWRKFWPEMGKRHVRKELK